MLAAWAVLLGASWTASQTTTAREIKVPLALHEDSAAQRVEQSELTVLLDNQVQDVRDLLRIHPSAGTGDDEKAWQVVVYFDAPLSTPDGLRQAALWLSREAEALTRLGPTEIVLADPQPRRYLEGSRNPAAVKETLRDIRMEALDTGELLWHRQRFSAARIDGENSGTARALQDETDLIDRQRRGLLRWLSKGSSSRPRLLILVQNGFDLNPRSFYSEQTAGSFLEDPRNPVSHSTLSRAIAADGWTVLCLALGPKPKEFLDPSAPLFELAHATGGEVITRRRGGTRILQAIPSWPILVVEIRADPARGPLPFEIVVADSRRHLQTRQWASTATLPLLEEIQTGPDLSDERVQPVLQLLRPPGLALDGEVRFRTIAGRHRIHRVVFLLDDVEVAETRKTPYSASIDLGAGIRPHTISAVAFSRSDRKLGEDSLRLNMALEPPRVVITQLDYDARQGVLEVTATASAPSGNRPEILEIYFNDRKEKALEQPPYIAYIDVAELRPEDYVRVLAHYASGEVAEAARLPASTRPADELDVNLVELLAMVTPRNRKAKLELDKSDFVIRQQGRSLSIDHFSQWQESSLTLGLVLDTSDSMDIIIEDAREAGERFFQDALKSGDEAFVVDFNSLPRLSRPTTADSDRLLHSLDGLEARGMTALYDAIVFSLQQFENTAGRRALVVVTDGEDSASYYQPRDCVRQARLHGVPVYLIVLGDPPDPHRDPELLRNRMVARRTGGEVYYLSNLEDLGRIYDRIVTELRRQYFLAFNTGHTLTPEELEEIEIEVVPKGIDVRTLLASQQRGG